MDRDSFRDRPVPGFQPDTPPPQLPRSDKPFVRHVPEDWVGGGSVDDIADRAALGGIARAAHTNDDPSDPPPTVEFPRRVPADQHQAVPLPVSLPEPARAEVEETPGVRVETAGDNSDDITGSDTSAVRSVPEPIRRLIGTASSDTTLEERHPDWPKVTLHFHFGPHGKAEDFKALPELVEGADVYCYEGVTGSILVEDLTRASDLNVDNKDSAKIDRIIDGTTTDTGNPVRGTRLEMQIRSVIGTGKAIGHFDAKPEAGDPNFDEAYDAAFNDYGELKETLEATLDNMLSAARRLSGLDRQRDTTMLGPTVSENEVTAGRFEQEMGRIFSERPDLKSKPEVRIVDTHGSMHDSVYHRARAAGVQVERSFASMPYTYPLDAELTRKIDRGIQPTREFLTQAFADGVLRNTLKLTAGIGESTLDPDVVEYVRTRAVTFDQKDAQQVFDAMKQEADSVSGQRRDTIDAILQSKGFGPLASTRDEVRADIAKRAAGLAEKKERVLQDMEERRRAQGS